MLVRLLWCVCVVIDNEKTGFTDGVGELAVTVTLIVGLDDDGLAASEAAVQQHNNFSVLDTVDNQARERASQFVRPSSSTVGDA